MTPHLQAMAVKPESLARLGATIKPKPVTTHPKFPQLAGLPKNEYTKQAQRLRRAAEKLKQ